MAFVGTCGRRQIRIAGFSSLILFFMATNAAVAGDWPTYLHDFSRSGSTGETISFPLNNNWSFTSPALPQPGNTGPDGRVIENKKLRPRIAFDDAFHVAVVGDRVYFGSSVDHQMRCVNASTGKVVWKFYCDAPIRLAPTVANGRVYFGSDDGSVYCLRDDTGKEQWKLRAGPEDSWLIGRQEMISRWPVRTGILVDNGVAYFGAGIFPHENIYLYAVDAESGTKIIWKGDNISQKDAGRNDLSPQGYLLANDDALFVPSGRTLPAAIDRKTGEILHKPTPSWRRDAGGVVGGTHALLADGQLYSFGAHHILALDQKNGKVGFGWLNGKQMAVTGKYAYITSEDFVVKVDRLEHAVASQEAHALDMEIYNTNRALRSEKDEAKRKEMRQKISDAQLQIPKLADVGVVWKKPSAGISSLVATGNAVIVGGDGVVSAFAADDGRQIWEAKVDGKARGLAVANGRVVVSTDTGAVYCYSADNTVAGRSESQRATNPFPNDEWSAMYASAADEILKRTGIKQGFCLVVGSENGRLAYEIAKRSDLNVYGVEPDMRKVIASRATLSNAGLYGSRITIHHAELSPLPYPNYFADLIVSDRLLLTGEIPGDPKQIARHLKPLGGVICLGNPSDSNAADVSQVVRVLWLAYSEITEQSVVKSAGSWTTMTRGKLPGAGSWSHQYGEPGNTACSDDRLVKGGLGVLWYGDPGEGKMVNRHEGAVGPLAINGRLFIQGETRIMAFDAYNGRFLWEIENPEAIRTGVFQNQNPGNLVASDDSLYFMMKDKCYRIDAATGKTVATYSLPDVKDNDPREWGYLAYRDGLLFGTASLRKELESKLRRRGRKTDDSTDEIFAIDTRSGKHLWTYKGQTIVHHTIGLDENRVYFIDSSITSEQRAAMLRQDKSELKKLKGEEAEKAAERMKRIDVRLAVALDAQTGKEIWAKPVDVTDCSEIGIGGGKLMLMVHNNVIVLCGANANGHYWKQFMSGEFSRRRLVALAGDDGHRLWAKDANYRHRPIIVEDKIIGEPWKFDLYTGAQEMRTNPLTGKLEPWSMMRSGHHCGMLSASPSMLFFRAGYTGFYDLDDDSGTQHFAGHRTGCWINMIPANGLLSIPESSAGCVCLFSISSTVVMEPLARKKQTWSIYSSTGAKTPVKHMALNLGAPGDRRDANGTVWLGYPRPKPSRVTSLDLSLDLSEKFHKGGRFVSVNPNNVEADDDTRRWIVGSWAQGLSQLKLPLIGKNDSPAEYTVRIHFANLDQKTAPATFDVNVQGKTAIDNLNLAKESAGSGKMVIREVKGVKVQDDLVIDFVPEGGNANSSQLPNVTAIELLRND